MLCFIIDIIVLFRSMVGLLMVKGAITPLFWLSSLSKTSNISCRKDEGRHPYLIPELREKVFSILPLSILLALSFSLLSFIRLKMFPTPSSLLGVFCFCFSEQMLILSKFFYVSIRIIICFFFFSLLIW